MTSKDLKNALLQEAVQGKLVPQIASEGNARDLLEEIRKARGESLPLATARKRSSATPSAGTPRNAPMEITEDEIPFDIPESWCWCRQSDIANISTGMTPLKSESKFYENGNIPWITSSLTNNEYIENAESFITEYAVENTSLTLYPKNTLILAMYGQGKTRGQISELLIPATINQACAAIELFLDDEYLRKYIKLFHNWNYNNVRKEASGSAQPNLNLGKVQSTLIPLPPLSEQKRIVAAIEKFMPLIEEYGKKETVLNELNAQIGTLTKKAILQEAVQGKLVPQIPAEGNAKDLLEQIRKERLSHGLDFANAKSGKKGKKETALAGSNPCDISEDEIPFDIPENWCWCRLGEICKFLSRGKSPKYSEIKKYPVFAQKCNLKDGEISLDQAQFLDPEVLPKWKEEYKIQDGDVLVNSTGTGTVMRTRYFKSEYLGNYPFVVPDSHVTVIRTFPEIDSKYIFYCCFGFTVQKYWEENLAGSTNQKELYIGVVGNTPIPLPPLSEQKRIVEAIEKMLPICEKFGK